jgi:palmitoyltransferase
MWFVWEACGIVCAIFTYIVVFTVQYGFIRIGIWEDLVVGNPWAFIHLSIFSFNVFMIIASHLKCMTTEPGLLPRDYEELNPDKLP